VAALAGIAAAIALTGGDPPQKPTAARATPTATPKPKATGARRAGGVAAGHRPTSVVLAQHRVWVGERRRTHLRAFAPDSLRPLRRAVMPSGISALATTPHGLWAALWKAHAIARIDVRTGRIAGTPIPVAGSPSTLTAGGGSLWVGLTASPIGGPGTVMRINQANGALLWSTQLPSQADRLVWLDGSLWAMVSTPNRLFRLDPATGTTKQAVDLPGSDADDLTAAGGRLWATVREPDSLVRLDLRTGQRAGAYVGRGPTGVSVHGNDVWVALWYSSQVALFDARTLKRQGRAVDVALNPFELTADATGAWVVCAGNARLVRVRKL
jgi:streptogramin lyase